MDEHFRAFSFVDRITEVEVGVRIRGRYTIPQQIDDFPPSLVAEAVGQLAAWSAMAKLDFQYRPVAGLAARIELLEPVQSGQTLDLAAELETVETDAVGYSGTASVDGKPVIRLEHCVGPMLPQEDFDEPQGLRERFAFLQKHDAAPGGFKGVPKVPLEHIGGETGQWKRAGLHVPESAPFFADHFPRRHVFPGTLLMHSNLQLAVALAGEIPSSSNGPWKLAAVSDVKLRSFTPPGEILECEVRLDECSDTNARLTVETKKGKKTVGGAKVWLSPEVRS